MIVNVCLIYIHVISLNVNRKKSLSVKINDLEGWLVALVRGDGWTDIVQHDVLTWVRHALCDLIVLVVGVARHEVPDYVLVSLHQCSVADTELVLEVIWWVVSDDDCDSTGIFDI